MRAKDSEGNRLSFLLSAGILLYGKDPSCPGVLRFVTFETVFRYIIQMLGEILPK